MPVPPFFMMSSAVAASILTLGAGALTGGAEAPSDMGTIGPTPAAAARLEATFTEGPPLSRTPDCAAEPKICQVVLAGNGSVIGFGDATEIAGVSQDRAVAPCGPGSDSEVYTRRIQTSSGVLALRARGVKCATTDGFRVTARYQIDGAASSGVFAGARGRGTDTVRLAPGRRGRVTLSGQLKLH